jgi:hypothetical protein
VGFVKWGHIEGFTVSKKVIKTDEKDLLWQSSSLRSKQACKHSMFSKFLQCLLKKWTFFVCFSPFSNFVDILPVFAVLYTCKYPGNGLAAPLKTGQKVTSLSPL